MKYRFPADNHRLLVTLFGAVDNVKNPPAAPGKNQRPCPALNGFISSTDCGAQRGSTVNCPGDCPFNPFAISGYDAWLKLDESWGKKATAYVNQHFGRDQFRELFTASLRPTEEGPGSEVLAYAHALYSALFLLRDSEGRTLTDRWEAEGWTGLNNDERVMMRYRRRSFVTVAEVQKVLDYQSALCTDALAPGSPAFVLVDRSTTPQMVRFTRLLGWLTHYPHFSRLGGVGLVVSTHAWRYWREVLDNRLAAERAQRLDLTLRELLTQNFIWATEVMTEVGLDYRQRIFQSLDMHHCIATYRILGSIQEVTAIMKSKPDFLLESAGEDSGLGAPLAKFAWVRRGESAELYESVGGEFEHASPPGSIPTVGSVRLFRDRLVTEVFSKKKYAFTRKMVDRFFGPLIRFDHESVVDIAEAQGLKEPKVKVSHEVAEVMDRAFSGRDKPGLSIQSSLVRVPPSGSGPVAAGGKPGPLANKAALLEATLQGQLRAILEHRVPALGGRTPRESARDIALRPQLLEWVKGLIHETETNNRRDGTNISVDWLLDELGLTELK